MNQTLVENNQAKPLMAEKVAVWDRLGLTLSFVCLIHCLATPLILISLPLLAKYYLLHPYFHLLMAALIIPIAGMAFYSGFKHHHKKMVFILGIPGLFLITFVPWLAHGTNIHISEFIFVSVGSVLMMIAHLMNYRYCRQCSSHKH